MSQVAISGNASGTGTLTIAAPNTNSNYTLTLPAATGTVASIASVNNNGVVYANSSGQPTTGTAFVFDGTNVGIGTSSPSYALDIRSSSLSGALGVNLTSGTTLTTAQGSTTNVDMAFVTKGTGLYTWTQGSTERMRIDSSGNLLVGCTSAPSTTVAGSGFVVESVGRKSLYLASNYTGATTDLIYLVNPNGTQGKAGTNSTGSYWSTSSDYRLKENIQPMQNALNKVALLKPCTYTWKSTGESGQGFIAHELQEIVPEAVIGEKDAVDADGNPDYQGIDTSFLVATLTAAIQEQQALITQLQADVAALKGK